MGFAEWWDDAVVSRIVRYGCGVEQVTELRRKIGPLASGKVFELGCGAGANQPFYDASRISSFTAIDPSPKLLEFAREAAAAKGWEADIRHGVGEDIPFADESFDTVVCTFTMCSVHDHARSLSELRRVLKPGGLFLFAEHGRAPDPGVARWQERIDPVWSRITGNCHLSRPITSAMEKAGFNVTPVAREYRMKPRLVGWVEWGSAVRLD